MVSTAPSTRKCSDHASPLAPQNRQFITPQKKPIAKPNKEKSLTSGSASLAQIKLELDLESISLTLLKSRGMNSNAGLTCSKLQRGIDGMFNKKEEKKERYFKRVEEIRNSKLDFFVLM